MQGFKVSIITPFKNTSSFLSECLDSILDQSYQHWEVLAVDDNSTDNSYQIVQSYAAKDKRIKVFRNNGSGIIPALRKAYSESTGDLITRMDSDDIMKPYRLETMVNALQESGIGHIAVGQVSYFSTEEISEGYIRYENWLNRLTALGTNYSEIYKECVIPSPCWMLHREDFEKSGAFNEDRYPEDYDLTFRFYEHNIKVIPCDVVLHLWREYDTRTSRTHEHYDLDHFLDTKLHYFLKLDYNPTRPLVIWAAGSKGKTLAKELMANDINFTWLNDNPNKVGRKIYGQAMTPMSEFEHMVNPQSIITIADEKSQEQIRTYLDSLGQKPMEDYFFFC